MTRLMTMAERQRREGIAAALARGTAQIPIALAGGLRPIFSRPNAMLLFTRAPLVQGLDDRLRQPRGPAGPLNRISTLY